LCPEPSRQPTRYLNAPQAGFLLLFIDIDDGSWNNEQPDTDDAVEAMLAVAA
jgi:hypothetical protein